MQRDQGGVYAWCAALLTLGSCPCMLHKLLSSHAATQRWPCCSKLLGAELSLGHKGPMQQLQPNSGQLKLSLSLKLSSSRPRQFACLSSSTTQQQPLNTPPRLSVSVMSWPLPTPARSNAPCRAQMHAQMARMPPNFMVGLSAPPMPGQHRPASQPPPAAAPTAGTTGPAQSNSSQ